MVDGYRQIRETVRGRDTDLRTAGFVVAIDTIARAYKERGHLFVRRSSRRPAVRVGPRR